MEKKTFEEFHKDLSWSTRFYVLAVIATIVLSFFFEAWSTNWAMTIIGAVSIVLFVETFAIYFHKHPKAWRTARWLFLIIILSLLFLSLF